MSAEFNWHTYSICVWFVNLIVIILSYWIDGMEFTCIPLFGAIVISLAAMIQKLNGRKILFEQILANAPVKYFLFLLVNALYTFVNFFICMYLLRDGGPHIHNGVYCLWNHGFIREITKEEYDALHLVEARMFSGHLSLFSALSVLLSCREVHSSEA